MSRLGNGSHFANRNVFKISAEYHPRETTKMRSYVFRAPKFYLVTIILKQDNVLQKHLISWHYLILQPRHWAKFLAVYLKSFILFWIFHISLSLFCVTVKLLSNIQVPNNVYQCQISKFLQDRIWMLLIFMKQCCFALQFDV